MVPRSVKLIILSQHTKTVIAAGFQTPRVFVGPLLVDRNLLQLADKQNRYILMVMVVSMAKV